MRENDEAVGREASYEERARAIFGARADLYATSASHTDRQVLARLVEIADPKVDWRVLDIGTGTGHTALAFAPHVHEVVGLDLTEEMLREARRLAQERGIGNVTFRVADVHSLPRELEGAFDLVTCRRAAHHFSDIHRATAEMARTLRSGGVLLIDDRSVPEDDWIDETMHRPVTAFTDRVSSENVAKIRAILDGLSGDERSKLRLETIDGEERSTHWYVIVAARKP